MLIMVADDGYIGVKAEPFKWLKSIWFNFIVCNQINHSSKFVVITVYLLICIIKHS